MGFSPAWAEAGALLSYGAAVGAGAHLVPYRQAASYVAKILEGARPADLPVQQPTRFELNINQRVAKALGLTIPQSILLQADEIMRKLVIGESCAFHNLLRRCGACTDVEHAVAPDVRLSFPTVARVWRR
jgi:hypothetical protein